MTLPNVSPLRRAARILVALAAGSALLSAASLEDVLARMDKSAAGFRSLTAKLKSTTYTALIKDTEEKSGRLTLLRPKLKEMKMLVEFDQPNPQSVSLLGRKVLIYQPKLPLVQEYDLGKQGNLVEQFLLLGFGTPGSELKKGYGVKLLGEETVRGVKCDHLELTPKSAEVLKYVRRIEVWVSQAEGITMRQKIHKPSQDFQLYEYSDIKVNPPVTEETVRLKIPKGVPKETPLK